MRVLVVGKGGREHALCWRLNQSPVVRRLFCASGSPGINQVAKPAGVAPTDIEGLVRFAAAEGIDLTVVGPEDPLASGIVDEFERHGLMIFGPSKAAALLEASKSFAKSVMREAGVSTADFEVFDDAAVAKDYIKNREGPLVVKADGLALGKGVIICEDAVAALAAVAEAMEHHRFGTAGNRIVIEERLRGEELSFFALCNGTNAISLGFVRDHKAVFDGDRGPNTGGMGAYSPVPGYDKSFEDRVIREVVEPTLNAMVQRGTPFKGVLFAGLMVDGDRINVLEFNVRFGDPECQTLMMRFEGDLAETLLAIAEGRTRDAAVKLSPRSAVAVVLASGGYPGDYRKGMPISGLEKIDGVEPSDMKVQWALSKTRVKVFHAGTALHDGRLVTDGGRVLAVTTMADGLEHAVTTAYQATDMIDFEGKHLRRDVGRRALVSNTIVPGAARAPSR
jgi:phosphoribosylamine---glycine ligase